MRLADNIRIKFRTTGISVTISSSLSQFLRDSRSDHEIITQFTAFRHDIAERIQNHRATVLDLIIITPDRIGEYHIYRIVVRPSGKPFHKPSTSLQAIELLSQGSRVVCPVLP